MMSNIKDNPKVSVIIPLKDRAEYIGPTLRTCMIQDYENFEIIVSDDCSDDNTVEVVRELQKQDIRIKLFDHKQHLGMRDNFEFALNQVTSGYVLALGGDDGLTPGCISRMVEIIKEKKVDLLTWTPAYFSYPHTTEDDRNMIRIPRKKFAGVKMLKSKDLLTKLSKTFAYQIDECPMLYMKGIASINLINKVKSRTKDGTFYYCPTPDGFSGVVLAGEVDSYAFTYEPLSIVGTTVKSQGQNYKRTDAKSRFEANQFFKDNIRNTMHPQLASQPYSPLVTLMTADYLLTAADLPGWPGKCYEVSIPNLLERTFKFIEKSNFDDAVLPRELNILYEIAKQHSLEALFFKLYENTKRKVVRAPNVQGLVITNTIRFDGSKLGIKDIFDASLVVNFIFKCYNQLSWKTPFKVLQREFQVVLRQYKYKKTKMPSFEIEKINVKVD